MKKLLWFLLFILFNVKGMAQDHVYQLSSHILDITDGKPVPNVEITLYKLAANDNWIKLKTLKTDENGRVKEFLPLEKSNLNHGNFKLKFETFDYFKTKKVNTFYPFIEVIFKIDDDKHYHVPITISPFGYSTYRGS